VQSYSRKDKDSERIFNDVIITLSTPDCNNALKQDLETEENSENENTRLAGTGYKQ